jgi:hypothetical protein
LFYSGGADLVDGLDSVARMGRAVEWRGGPGMHHRIKSALGGSVALANQSRHDCTTEARPSISARELAL